MVGPVHILTAGSQGSAVSYDRGTPVMKKAFLLQRGVHGSRVGTANELSPSMETSFTITERRLFLLTRPP